MEMNLGDVIQENKFTIKAADVTVSNKTAAKP